MSAKTRQKPAKVTDDVTRTRKLFKDIGQKVVADWQGWKDLIWDSMHERMPYEPGKLDFAGLACLEQYMHRSKAERRCIECGDPGTVQCQSHLVKLVDMYWMCAGCSAWWEHKSCTRRSHKRCGVAS